MLRSSGRPHLKAGLAVASAMLASMTFDGLALAAGIGSDHAAVVNTVREKAPTETDQPLPARAAEQAGISGWTYRRPCENVENPEQAGLCQQLRLADAAEWQLRAMVVGVGLLIVTLIFSAWAALAAGRASRAVKVLVERGR